MRLDQWFQLTYRASERTPVSQRVSVAGSWDLSSLLLVAAACSLLLLCCCLITGVRRRRLHSAMVAVWCIGTGVGLLTAYWHPSWSTMAGSIRTPLAFHSRQRVHCRLLVQFGLHGADLVLTPAPSPSLPNHHRVYKEQLMWPLTPAGMTSLYRSALRRGLTSPLVRALEVLSKDAGPCTYGRHLRRAGYMAGWLLTGAIAGWLVSLLLMASVPALAARTMLMTAALSAASVGAYIALVPGHNMALRYNGRELPAQLGWCLWLVVAVAAANAALAGYVLLLQRCRPGGFSSLFELDFDSPLYRCGWAAPTPKPPPKPKTRNGELTLNIAFARNDLDGAAPDTPGDLRFYTPRSDPQQQPFWTPGSMPRPSAPDPPQLPLNMMEMAPIWPQSAKPDNRALFRPAQTAGPSTCHHRTPRKSARARSHSGEPIRSARWADNAVTKL